jgi:hypothetical protein
LADNHSWYSSEGVAVVAGVLQQVVRFVELALHEIVVAAGHGVPASFLLGGVGADLRRKPPRAGLRGLGQRQHGRAVALVVGGLGLLQQHVSLHRQIAGDLRPLGGAVTPERRQHRVADVPIEPAGELGPLCTQPQQFLPDIGLDLARIPVDGVHDRQHGRQSAGGASIAVGRFAGVELAAGRFEGGGYVLRLVD